MQFFHPMANYLTLITIIALMSAGAASSAQADSTNSTDLEPLVTVQWLSTHIDDPDLVILDCTVVVEADESGGMRNKSGRAGYEAGHIPSAGFADLTKDLSAPDNTLEFSMPTLAQFSATMGALGVGEDSRVVLYSATQPDWAARVWWMLRWAGFDQVALLDGGLKAWVADGRAISTSPVNRTTRQFVAAPRPELIADRDHVLAAIDDASVSLVDAMPDVHYRGEFAMYARPGHILSATNMPSSDLLDEEGRYRSYDELDMMHGGDRNNRVITYCGGGVASASVAFTMHRLGFTDIAVYMASLQEWTADPTNPMSLDTLR